MLYKNRIFTLIRHGETDQNKENRFIGTTDTPLNEKGRDQAHVTALHIMNQNWVFDHILCSPSQRCQETASIIQSYTDTPITTTELLKERNYGIFENKTRQEVASLYPDWNTKYKRYKPFILLPEGESALDVEQRIRALLWDEIPKDFPQDTQILLITHLNPIRAIFHLLSLNDWKIYYHDFQPTSISRIETNYQTANPLLINYSCF